MRFLEFHWRSRMPRPLNLIFRCFVIWVAQTQKCLPVPMMNIINGGAHSDAPIDFQEFMIMPKGAPTFSEALRYGTEVFHALKSVLKSRGLSTAVGDEGGFAPNLKGVEDTLDTISKAIEKAGYKLGEDIFLALDAASSEFYEASSDTYVFKKSDGSRKSADELIAFYQEICSKYPIISIEDGCSENDWARMEETDGRSRREGAARR